MRNTEIRPLSDVVVCDFSQVFAGPYCTHQLTLLGARVEKVEPVGKGDILRKYQHGGGEMGGLSGSFIAVNAGKRSIELDLKSEEGLEIAERLVAGADVVVENFRPGVMDRLGLSWERCRELNDKLIYVSISGYGSKGPMRDYPAYDHNMQAMSGMMTLNGGEGDDYMKVGFPAIDCWVGFTAAFAILAALRQRDATGEGQYIDVAMLDAAMVMMTSMVVPYMNAGKVPPRMGNRGYSGSPTADQFACGNGHVALGANWPVQYEALCKAIGRPDLIEDPRFLTKADRIANDEALREQLEGELRKHDGEHWEKVLNAVGVPTSKVRTIAEALRLEQFDYRSLFQEVPVSRHDETRVRVLNTGFEAPWSKVEEPAPLMGEHCDEILRRLGYGEQDIARLKADGVAG